MQYITSQTLFRLRVLLIAGTVAILGIVFVDIFLGNSSTGSQGRKGKNADVRQEDLKIADELLHARLWQLQDMDQQFASLLSRQYDENALTKTNASIQAAEAALKKSIDSLTEVGVAYDQAMGTNDFQNMTTFFQKILENRRFIAFTRMGVISGDGSPNEKQTILKLQNELYEKDKLIAASATDKTVISLQGQLGDKDKRIFALETQLQKEEAEKQGYVQSTQKLQGELAEKDKIIASLGNRNTGPDQKAVLDLQKELSAKNKQIGDLQSELGEKTKLLADAGKKQPSDQKALAALQNEVNVKNKQIGDLQKQVQAEKQNYTQAVQRFQSELTEKDKIIANANKRLPADQKSLTALQNEVSSKNKQISDLQSQIQRELAEKKANTQKFQNDLAQKNKMIDALSNIKIPTDNKALASLQKEVRAKDKQISDLEMQVEQLNSTIASSSKAPTDQRGSAALQNELTTRNRQIAALQAELRKEQAEKQGFSKTINELQLELIEKNKILASNSSIARPAVSNGESSRDLTNLRLAYNNTMTQLGVLQKKYNSLKAEMDQIKGQR